MSIRPIFLLSLPRSGSTLLQRLLGLHEKISTKSEPWIALPPFFALEREGVEAVYGHNTLATEVSGLVSSLPNGLNDYTRCVARFLTELYSLSASDNAVYFLDKTPRYHLIVNRLMDSFPEAKFIFLWRNPLAVCASMLQSYDGGKWNLYMFLVDLYSGVESLIDAYASNRGRSIAVKYEDLVASPDSEMRRILTYLELDHVNYSARGLKNAEIMRGDRTGQVKYSDVSRESVDAWPSIMSNPYRKVWATRYLEWIGPERLQSMGYDLEEFLAELRSQKTTYRFILSDIIRSLYGNLYCRYALGSVRGNKRWRKTKYLTRN